MNTALRNLTTGAIRVTAELALTAGFVLLLFAFYLLVWSNQRTAAAQDDLLSDFRSQSEDADGATSKARPGPGDGVAVMHIPRLGDDWEWVVVEGTEDSDLRNGPGRFTDSAMPGKMGNFALAGHRATHGEPFAHVDRLEDGDQIVVETAKEWLVYQVAWSRIVAPTATEVIAPVAGHPGQKPTQRTMTLVTCHPRWGSTERLVIGSQLVERRSAAAGPPDGIL
ncbi:class E sortase [Nocardioides gilvus]|uniref:class E sortase n=1 Tax=Nocardioides gilvus TaxID=1735589 RepID=UPI000D7499F3|nr:class E sortase [Nocardioides gilvus]